MHWSKFNWKGNQRRRRSESVIPRVILSNCIIHDFTANFDDCPRYDTISMLFRNESKNPLRKSSKPLSNKVKKEKRFQLTFILLLLFLICIKANSTMNFLMVITKICSVKKNWNKCVGASVKLFFQFHEKFRSNRSQIFFKIDVLKNFANFKEEHLCLSLFLITLKAQRPATSLKRDSNRGVFCLN